MTDTAYLYQYFLENSTVKKDAGTKDVIKQNKQQEKKEGKCDGKSAKQRA